MRPIVDVVGIQTDPAAKRPEASGVAATRSCESSGAGAFGRFARRCRQSIWFPVALKVGTACCGMSALAAIGATSIALGPGVPVDFESPLAQRATLGLSEAAVQRTWTAPASTAPPPAAAHVAAATVTRGAEALRKAREEPQSSPGVTADGKIVLNVATAEELVRLPGVGRKRADAIVALRTRLKRFRRVTDLLRVRGIGIRSLAKIRPLVVLDPPPPPAAPPAAGGGRVD